MFIRHKVNSPVFRQQLFSKHIMKKYICPTCIISAYFSVSSHMGFSVYHVDKRKQDNTKYKKSNIKIDITEKKKGKIPLFFEMDITFLGYENYRICTDNEGKITIYVVPLIRTLLLDIKINVNKEESLSRVIKEKINANARLLLKKSVENSKIITIKDIQYLRVNANVSLNDNILRIMNDKEYKKSYI